MAGTARDVVYLTCSHTVRLQPRRGGYRGRVRRGEYLVDKARGCAKGQTHPESRQAATLSHAQAAAGVTGSREARGG